MENGVLVAYASKYGATAEIAEKISQVLSQTGLQVEVLAVNHVSDLSQYQAFVLGSAVYIGKWRKEMVKFLQNNEKLMAERSVWLFSSGPTGEGDPVKIMEGWRFPEAQQPIIERIQPRNIAFFHGMLDMKKLNFLERLAVKGMGAPAGDFRDWNAITAWATDIAGLLKTYD